MQLLDRSTDVTVRPTNETPTDEGDSRVGRRDGGGTGRPDGEHVVRRDGGNDR